MKEVHKTDGEEIICIEEDIHLSPGQEPRMWTRGQNSTTLIISIIVCYYSKLHSEGMFSTKFNVD